MYVAVKGRKAIEAAHQLQEQLRRGDDALPAIGAEQIEQQLGLAVDRVMTEGGIYDRELAALAIKQASGDLVEAIFLLRAYRTTLPRLAVSEPLASENMRLERRISAVYKDLPGGQVLGPTYDYTHRLLDFALLAEGEAPRAPQADEPLPDNCSHVFDLLCRQQLAREEQDDGSTPDDITRNPPVYPARAQRACSSWCAATKVFCWRSATPPSAATAATTRSPARSAPATFRWRSCLKSSVSPSISAKSC